MTDDRFKQGALSVYVGFENCAWLQVRRTSELNDEQHLSTYLTADGVTSEDKN
jgi:hypothetical protein